MSVGKTYVCPRHGTFPKTQVQEEPKVSPPNDISGIEPLQAHQRYRYNSAIRQQNRIINPNSTPIRVNIGRNTWAPGRATYLNWIRKFTETSLDEKWFCRVSERETTDAEKRVSLGKMSTVGEREFLRKETSVKGRSDYSKHFERKRFRNEEG